MMSRPGHLSSDAANVPAVRGGSKNAAEFSDSPMVPAAASFCIPKLEFSRIAFFSSHGGSNTRGVVDACGQVL